MAAQSTDPLAQAYAAYEQLETKLGTALEGLVATNGFSELFTTSATTVMALVRMANGTVDQAVRATRLAARQDVTGLARQLARTEDKLEKLLQLVEDLEAKLEASEATRAAAQSTPAKAGETAKATEPAKVNGTARTNGTASRARRTSAAVTR